MLHDGVDFRLHDSQKLLTIPFIMSVTTKQTDMPIQALSVSPYVKLPAAPPQHNPIRAAATFFFTEIDFSWLEVAVAVVILAARS